MRTKKINTTKEVNVGVTMNDWTDFMENLDYFKARKHKNEVVGSFYIIRGTVNNWNVSVYRKVVYVLGRKFFVKTERYIDISYRKGKWYGASLNSLYTCHEAFEDLIIKFEREWFIEMIHKNPRLNAYTLNKRIFQRVISGTISSEEDFYKAIVKTVYHLDISWKAIRSYLSMERNFGVMIPSIWDIEAFTVNPENTIKELCECDRKKKVLINDCIDSAAQLDIKINALWSEKRLEQEHQNHIRTINAAVLKNVCADPIYDDVSSIETKNVKIITSEKECLDNAMIYNNCSYNSYWNPTRRGTYILAIIRLNGEEAMLGINIYKGKAEFNQVFKKFNQQVSPIMSDYVMKYIEVYNKELVELKRNDVSNKERSVDTMTYNRILRGERINVEEQQNALPFDAPEPNDEPLPFAAPQEVDDVQLPL